MAVLKDIVSKQLFGGKLKFRTKTMLDEVKEETVVETTSEPVEEVTEATTE